MTTTVEASTRTLNDLMDQRDALTARSAKLAEDRQKISYAALTGNKDAKERLRKLNDESVMQNAELENIDSAIAEAKQRLASAQQAEVLASDRASAELLKAALDELIETGNEIDLAFIDLIAHASNLQATLNRIHQLGCPYPTSAQLMALGEIAARTALMQTPWARAIELVPPPQRRDFRTLIDAWSVQVRQNIDARLGLLGEQSKTTEAA